MDTETNVDRALRAALSAGPMGRVELVAMLARDGFTEKQLRRARERLGVIVSRAGFGARMRSTWELPNSQELAHGRIRAHASRATGHLRKHKVGESSPTPKTTAAESARIERRVARFVSRGLPQSLALAVATELVVQRDRPGLRLTSCAECHSFSAAGCAAVTYTGGSRNPLEIWACGWCRRDAV